MDFITAKPKIGVGPPWCSKPKLGDGEGAWAWKRVLVARFIELDNRMMTYITRGGEGREDKNKDRKATRSEGRGLEESASRAIGHVQHVYY